MQVNKQTNTHSLSPYLQCLPIFFSCNLNINAFVSNAFFPMDYVRSTMNCFCWWISLEAKHVKSFHSFCIVLIFFGSCVCTIWSEKYSQNVWVCVCLAMRLGTHFSLLHIDGRAIQHLPLVPLIFSQLQTIWRKIHIKPIKLANKHIYCRVECRHCCLDNAIIISHIICLNYKSVCILKFNLQLTQCTMAWDPLIHDTCWNRAIVGTCCRQLKFTAL